MNRIVAVEDSYRTHISDYPALSEMDSGLGPLRWHGIKAKFVEVRGNVTAGALVIFNAIDRQHVLGPKNQLWPHGEDVCRVYVELNGTLSWHDVNNRLSAQGAAIDAYHEAIKEAEAVLRGAI